MGARKTPMTLTPREEKFVLLYVLTGNGAEAIRSMGYKPASAANATQMAKDFRRRPAVKAAIEKLVAERAARVGVKQEEIMSEVRGLSLACETDRDRLTAYNMLGKALNMWSERTVIDIGSQTLEQMVLAADRLAREGAGKVAEALKIEPPPDVPEPDREPDPES